MPGPFTDEDRATLDRFAKSDVGSSKVGKATARALAYIDQLEGALEAADELAGCADRDYDREDYWTRLDEAVLAYRLARAGRNHLTPLLESVVQTETPETGDSL